MRYTVSLVVTLGFLFSGCVTDKTTTPPDIKTVQAQPVSETPKAVLKEPLPPVEAPISEEKTETSKIIDEKTPDIQTPSDTAQPAEIKEEVKTVESVNPEEPESVQSAQTPAPSSQPETAPASTLEEPSKTASVSGSVSILGKNGEKQSPGHVLVTLEPFDSALIPARDPKVFKMAMENKEYVPADLVVRVGDQVAFDNLDSFRHNVFSLSEENKFDLGTYGAGERPGVTFQKTGVVKVYCNIHPDMAAFILVSRTDWSAVTDENGNFKVEGLPAGEYVLKAWSLRAELEKQVTVKAGESLPVSIELDASKYQPAPHMNKFGKEYPRNFADDESY